MQKDSQEIKILVVEDNEGDYFLVEEYLKESFLAPKIVWVKRYKELIELLNKQNDFTIILLDLSLPDKSGKELVMEILDYTISLPVVVLTGYTDFTFAKDSLSVGISDYLVKDDLTSAILYKSVIYNIERFKSLRILKESEQRYSDLFHLSPLPMWVYDLETLNFMDVNEAALVHYGFTKEEFLSMSIKDIRPEAEMERLNSVIEQLRITGHVAGETDFIHKKKNGELIHVDIRGNVINFRNKKAELILVNDITERLNHINAIELQNSKLKEIAWTQSHVVRAPMARMMALINLINDDNESESEKMKMLKLVLDSANELDTIIKDIANKSQQIQDN